MTRRFATGTEVPVERSRSEIERLITRYGATSTAYMQGADKAMILFEAKGRRVMFELPLPKRDEKRFTHYRIGRASTRAIADMRRLPHDEKAFP